MIWRCLGGRVSQTLALPRICRCVNSRRHSRKDDEFLSPPTFRNTRNRARNWERKFSRISRLEMMFEWSSHNFATATEVLVARATVLAAFVNVLVALSSPAQSPKPTIRIDSIPSRYEQHELYQEYMFSWLYGLSNVLTTHHTSYSSLETLGSIQV